MGQATRPLDWLEIVGDFVKPRAQEIDLRVVLLPRNSCRCTSLAPGRELVDAATPATRGGVSRPGERIFNEPGSASSSNLVRRHDLPECTRASIREKPILKSWRFADSTASPNTDTCHVRAEFCDEDPQIRNRRSCFWTP